MTKSDSKYIYNATFELYIHQRNLNIYSIYQGFYKNIKQHKCFQLIIRNVSWAANQHIRMISEKSCDAEDWSNDAENFVKNHFKSLFWSNKCSPGENKRLLSKH